LARPKVEAKLQSPAQIEPVTSEVPAMFVMHPHRSSRGFRSIWMALHKDAELQALLTIEPLNAIF
jgi:hypothetical protein